MWASLQPALLPGNSCSLHLPALHGGYLRKVRVTPPFQERESALLWQNVRVGLNQPDSFLSVNMCMSFLVKYTLTQGGKQDMTQSAKFLYTSEIILIRVGPNQGFSQILPVIGACKHLCQVSSASHVGSTDAVKATVMFTKQTPRHKHRGEAIVDGLLTESNNVQLWRLSWKRALFLPQSKMCQNEFMHLIKGCCSEPPSWPLQHCYTPDV